MKIWLKWSKKSASSRIINLISQKLEEINTVDWSLIGWLERIIYHWLNTISSSWYNWKKMKQKDKLFRRWLIKADKMELIAPYKLNLSGLNAFLKATNSDFKYIYHSKLKSLVLLFYCLIWFFQLKNELFVFLPDCLKARWHRAHGR